MNFEHDLVLMSLVIFVPSLFAIALLFIPRGQEEWMRWVALFGTAVTLVLSLFLILETGMLGTFLALDFFLFYIFWEVMLLPMYFLIGVWGGPRREYAAIKFFLYTLLGSVFILIALLGFYFADVHEFAFARAD